MYILTIGLIVLVLMVVSFAYGYATGCVTGREETMDLYNNPNEQ